MLNLGYPLVLRRLVTSTLYKTFRLIFTAIQTVVWELNGTAARVRETRKDERLYDQSAQVLNIVAYHAFCVIICNMENFIWTHNRFVNPRYVIDNDHISLYKVDDEKAVFIEARNKDMLLWKSEYSPFIRFAQYEYGVRFIIVPLYAFHRMAETIGDPKAELTFLINTGRCGSTLLNQVMEYTERCVAISEPQTVDYVAQTLLKRGDSREIRQLARDVIRWECRPYKTMALPPLGYFLKISAPSSSVLPVLHEIFPRSRNLFMYRDTLATVKSIYRLTFPLPSLVLANGLGRLSGKLTAKMINEIGWPAKDYNYRLENDLSLGTLTTAVTMKTYIDMRRHGFPIKAIRYEELVAKPLDACRRLMEYCGLPIDLAELAVRGLKVDSQRNSPIAQNIIGNIAVPKLTKESKASLNRILAKFELPLIDEDCILEGTMMVNENPNRYRDLRLLEPLLLTKPTVPTTPLSRVPPESCACRWANNGLSLTGGCNEESDQGRVKVLLIGHQQNGTEYTHQMQKAFKDFPTKNYLMEMI